ncbi:MAG: SelA-like pyridoxal phosphate-dependent enzyme, partial [Bacilli bacterium]
KLEVVKDLAGRDIIRVLLSTKESIARDIVEFLTSSNLTIETRNHQLNLGKIEFDVRQITKEEALVIAQKLNEYMEGK